MKPELHNFPRILIIDKDEDDFRFFREAIARVAPGISVSCSRDIDRLVEVVDQTRPSLIFIEYRLPKEDGIACVRRLRSCPHLRGIPVIMWSTHVVLSVVGSAYNAGVQLYLEKPWELNAWVKEIKMILDRYGKKPHLMVLQPEGALLPS